METITLKPFKSGNSLALRIPASLKLKETDEFILSELSEGKFILEVGKEESHEEKAERVFRSLEKNREIWDDFELPEDEPWREVPEW